MINRILFTAGQTFYLFSPLLVAAAVSGVVLRFDLLPSLRRPIDGGMRCRGKRLFGDNKTWRGVITAVLGSIFAVLVQKYVLGKYVLHLALIDYAQANPLLLGLAIGCGNALGELPNSFVKRQIGIAPGATGRGFRRLVFYLWDQLDLLSITWPLLLFWIRPTLLMIAISILLVLAVHPMISLIGYLIGARKTAR